MNTHPTQCPDPLCLNHGKPAPGFYRKRGYFKPKCRAFRLARYQCKACGKTFSNRTGAADAQQHKPEINLLLSQLLCSGVTLRRAAVLLRCTYKTVCKKAVALAQLARLAHEKALQGETLKTT